MKKQLFPIIVFLGICMLAFFSSNVSNHVKFSHHVSKTAPQIIKVDGISSYYQGDTDNGEAAAYAVYGNAACCVAGTSVTAVYQYSTGDNFTATGSTYGGKTTLFSARLTASNGYYWNGSLSQ